MKIPTLFLLFLLTFSCLFLGSQRVFAQQEDTSEVLATPKQENSFEAKITKILEEARMIPAGGKVLQLYQKLELTVISGSQKGKVITIENGNLPSVNNPKYVVGDTLILIHDKDTQGKDVYFITDYARHDALLLLFVIFTVLTHLTNIIPDLTTQT